MFAQLDSATAPKVIVLDSGGDPNVALTLAAHFDAQCPTISQTCGRKTAMWSVIVLAFDGPTPMLTIEIPEWSGRIRWKAGICGSRPVGAPVRPSWVTCALPGSISAV